MPYTTWINTGKYYDQQDIAKYVIYTSYKQGKYITNLRLQKILYFLQLIFLDIYNKPCFDAKMEAWDLGPAIPDIYKYYEEYGTQFLPPEKTSRNFKIKKEEKETIDSTISLLSKYSTIQLIGIVKSQTPWKKNYVYYDSSEIPLEDLKEFVKVMKESGNKPYTMTNAE